MSEDLDFVQVTGTGVRLGPSWPALPASHLGVGIGFLPGALLAWCAPKVGRVSTNTFADDGGFDRLELTAWLIDQGFEPDQAADASCELLSRLNIQNGGSGHSEKMRALG